ncbi:dihydroorotase [Sphingorhabdus lutea]|uniref:Dihydroorotase n=1 Tax=Sphingorhabdus lutea TaxID=1913578 RepID=A0A1L3JE24_9SPHN|nr:dihydroorotase [Sphingorhabdus lutea]APG63391.1 dihydroorotase [Sphingorhabdus lutea]
MSGKYDLILKNGTVHSPGGPQHVDVAVKDGKIAALGHFDDAGKIVDCTGLDILPGMIDSQVHFREPGLEHKEDLESGSRCAVMGGITAVFEMPNTNPNTDTKERIEDKLSRAYHRMWCDHAFYVGATGQNAEELLELEKMPGTSGVKIFMGASTGNLLVKDDEALERVLRSGTRRVAIHSEDEYRMNEREHLRVEGDPSSHPIWRDDESAMMSTKRIIALARKTGRRIHILHITTPAELELISQNKDLVTCELLPQHLTLDAETAYAKLGSYAQMNPPIRSKAHQDGLWHWLNQGVPDVMGSDHAPHTKEEKAKPYPASPSGMPGVQTILPLMLNHVAHGRTTLQRVIELFSAGPQRIFGLVGKGRIAVGYDADFTVVDLAKKWTITNEWLQSKCGWSPFEGMEITGKPVGTFIRGHQVMWNDVLADKVIGEPVRFQETYKG